MNWIIIQETTEFIINNFILGYTNIHNYLNLLDVTTVFPSIQSNNVSKGSNYFGNGRMFLRTDRKIAKWQNEIVIKLNWVAIINAWEFCSAIYLKQKRLQLYSWNRPANI